MGVRFDKLTVSGMLVPAVFLFCAAVPALLLIDSGVRPQTAPGRTALVRGLSLTHPALIPSGRPQRAPEMLDPAVDLRFTPTLPRWDPETVALLPGLNDPMEIGGQQ